MAITKILIRMSIALSLALTSGAGVAEETHYFSPNIIDRLGNGVLPIDERERLNYEEAIRSSDNGLRERNRLLVAWQNRASDSKSFEQLQNSLRQDQPEMWNVLFKEHVDHSDYVQFYAESLLLFRMLRNGQAKTLIDDQFLHWRKAWLTIDMRLIKDDLATQWSNVLGETFALALIEAGPWSVESENRVDKYFAQRPEFAGRTRTNLVKTLMALSFGGETRARREVFALLGVSITVWLSTLFAYQPVPTFIQAEIPNQYQISAFLGSFLSTLIPAAVAGINAIKWPQSYEYLGKRFSLMFPPGAPRCQDLLTRGKRHE